jgi:hypothetical protein
MIRVSPQRRLAIFLCAVLLLLVSLTPAAPGYTLAILVCSILPVALFIGLAPVFEEIFPEAAPALAAFSPRPPPAR